MKLLFICEIGHYRDWKGKTYSDLIEYYKNNSKNQVDVIYFCSTLNILDSGGYDFNNKKPDMIIFFTTERICHSNNPENFILSFIFDLGIKVFVCSLDLFYFNFCKNDIYFQKCNGIIHFSHASKILDSYKEVFPNKKILSFKGRFINTNKFKNYNLDKKYDILIYGSRNVINKIEEHCADQEYIIRYNIENNIFNSDLKKHNFYPLREKIENLLLKNKNKYNLKILPQSTIYDGQIVNEDLSQLINESWLTLSCSTRADIAMAKYFEIAASYSCVLGDIPSDYTFLFKNNIVEVTEWMSDEEILCIIDNALSDKKNLTEMTKRLGDKINSEYNLDSAVEEMDNIFEQIIL